MLSLNDKIDLALLGRGIIVEADEDIDEKDSTRFIHSKSVDRTAMKDAMKNSGHTVSSLAQETGVEPSMISRMLREPKRNDPDESARNPSISLAAKVSAVLASSPESLFPDIFDLSKAGMRGKKTKKSGKNIQHRGTQERTDGT